MSGGAFDYRDNTLFDLKDMVAREIGFMEYGGEDDGPLIENKQVIEYMKRICTDLRKLGKVLRSLDWYLSGDIGEEEFLSDAQELYGESKR
jgi:hypothetical protein